MRFPVSVYVRGNYKNFIDLEYYLYHLTAYGVDSVPGGYIRLAESKVGGEANGLA